MVTAKFSKQYEAVRSRIKRLPKLVRDAADGQIKRDLDNVVDEYQKGMEINNFRLKQLSSFTVQNKKGQGKARPRSPLYGEGSKEKNSLYNALAIRKIKNGWRLWRRRAKHHESDLSLRDLLAIHEHGAIIQVTDRMRNFLHFIGMHLKASTTLIRIPPRPIVDKAIQRMLRKKKRNENVGKVKAAIDKLVKTGNQNELIKLADYEARHEATD